MPSQRYSARITGVGPPVEKVTVVGPRSGGAFPAPPGRVQVVFDHAEYSDVDFRGVVFWFMSATASTFVRCRFDRAKIAAGFLSSRIQTVYRECVFANADLAGVKPGTARFDACDFSHARIDGWRTLEAEFLNCSFAGPLRDVVFFGRPIGTPPSIPLERDGNEFVGNDFRHADFVDVDFRAGIDITQQLLPTDQGVHLVLDGTDALDRGRAVVTNWPDGADREEALRWLGVLAIGHARGEAIMVRPEQMLLTEKRRTELLLALRTRAVE